MLRQAFQRRSDSFHVSQTPPGWVIKGYGEQSYSGKNVTVEGSLSVTAVLAALTIVSEDTASLPLILYRRLERGKERANDHPLYRLLHDAPNPEHTSMVYREFITGHLLAWGNHFSQKIWDRRGVLQELWPLRPDRMKVLREGGVRKYLYTTASGAPRAFREEEIWHIPGFGFDGLVGYSRISLARNAIGLSMAAEEFGSKVFSNGARPSVVLLSKKQLSEKAQENLIASWNATYAGSENSNKTAVLEEEMDLKEVGFPPEDAQFLQTRQFQVAEVARIFRVPPHMIGDVERSTSWGSGIEQQEMGYLSHTLRPGMTRIEQGIWKDLLLKEEQDTLFAEHLAEALLRTNLAERMSAYVSALNNGILNPNEARERENLNPYAGGDTYRVQLNTFPINAQPKTPAAPAQNSLPVPAPLLQDAIDRITRRELHDLGDARRRWGAQKNPQKLGEWCERFYGNDHPAFIAQALQPFVAAGYLQSEAVRAAAGTYCTRRLHMEGDTASADLAPEILGRDLIQDLEEQA